MVIRVLVEELPPLTLTATRVTIAATVLFLILAFKRERLPKSLTLWGWCFAVGLCGTALPFFLISWGEQRIEASAASILMSVMPLATLILAHFFTARDRITVPKFIGILTGFCGVLVLVGPEAVKGLGGDLIYQIATACGALSYAVSTIIARNFPASPLLSRTTAVMICAAVQMIPLSLALDQPWTLTPGIVSIISVIYLGIFPTALAGLVFFYLIAVRGPSFIAYVNYMIPLAGVGWGILLLGEKLTTSTVLALVIILIGIAIANYRQRA